MTAERRRYRRVAMHQPARVRGWAADDAPWPDVEMTATNDVSSSGCKMVLRHPVSQGQVLMLVLPLPKNFRDYDFEAASYQVYAVVRHVDDLNVGLLFLGKHPPRGFAQHPGERVLLPGDPDPARQAQRFPALVKVRLRRTLVPPGTPNEEITVTEKIGQQGAIVRTGLPIQKGEEVELQELGGPFRGRASIDGVTIGKDNVPRLELTFLDADAPEQAREWLQRQGVMLAEGPAAGAPRAAQPHMVPAPPPPPSIAPRPPTAAPPPAPTAPPIGFDRMLFEPCDEGNHSACSAVLPVVANRRVKLCNCRCHL